MGGKAAESDEDKMVDAARHGRFQEVRDWLAKGVDVNYYSDDGGRSVFVRACTRAHACVRAHRIHEPELVKRVKMCRAQRLLVSALDSAELQPEDGASLAYEQR